MSNHTGLRDIWAVADKSIMDIMTKKSSQSLSVAAHHSSGEDSSDVESVDTSYSPFAAIPKEFRPSLPARPKIEQLNRDRARTEVPNRVSIQHKIGTVHFSNTRLADNRGSAESGRIPPANGSFRNETAVPDRNAAGVDGGEQTSSSFRNRIPFSVKNSVLPKLGKQSPKHPEIPNSRQLVQNTAAKGHDAGKVSSGTRKKERNGPFAPFQNRNLVFRSRSCNFQNEKRNALKYEVVGKQEPKTMRVDFQMPSSDTSSTDRLKYDSKFTGERKEVGIKSEGRNFAPGAKTNPNEARSRKSPTTWNKVFQECLVKWDSSLSLGNHSPDGTEGEIKWKFVQEQKPVAVATQTAGKKCVYKKGGNERPPDDRGHSDKKPARKHYPQKNSNINPNGNGAAPNPKARSRARRRRSPNRDKQRRDDNTTPTPTDKSDPGLNNNLARVQNEFRNSKIGKTCCNAHDNNCTQRQSESINGENFTHLDVVHRTVWNDLSTLETRCKSVEKVDNELKPAIGNIHPTSPDDIPTKPDLTEYDQLKPTAVNLEDFNRNLHPRVAKMDDHRNNDLLEYGREMSDLIIGSHKALSLFFSFYKEWTHSRLKLINHFEQLAKELKESTKRFTRFREILNFANRGAAAFAVVPVPHVSMAARVLSIITGLFSAMFPERKRTDVENADDLTSSVSRDVNATSDLYMYGLQCHQQFEDTAKQIERFCASAVHAAPPFEGESPKMADFVRGVLEYKPTHRIFYKKLQKCFQELLQSAASDFENRFCEPFSLYPSRAVDVIEFLDWRFNYVDFNPESVRYEMEQIQSVIHTDNPLIEDLLKRIQDCVRMMRDELEFIEGCVKKVSSFENSLEKSFAYK